MAGELILFPVRVYFRAARFAVRTSLRATERAVTLAARPIRSITPDGSEEPPERPAPRGRARAPIADIPVPEADVPAPEADVFVPEADVPAAVADVPAPEADAFVPEADAFVPEADVPAPEADVFVPEAPPLGAEPEHVSEEPTVVEEFAEPGAEDGAGAEVTIAEPWDAYARMNATDVIARLADASPEELAAVELYESAHSRRESVIQAAARELRAKSGRGAATADQSRKEQPDG